MPIAREFRTGEGSDEQIANTSAAWSAGAAANTVVNVDVALPTLRQKDALYLVQVANPSTETALDCTVLNGWLDDAGGTQRTTLTVFTVSANTKQSFLIQGWSSAGEVSARLSLKNAASPTAEFTARINVRKV